MLSLKRAFKFSGFTTILGIFLLTSCLPKDKMLSDIIPSGSPFVKNSTEIKPNNGQLPLQEKTLEEILFKLKIDYQNFQTLKAKINFQFFNSEGSLTQQCQARVSHKTPGRTMVKAYKELIPNFFTLATDNPRFWFYVPRYNTVYIGLISNQEFSRGFEIQLDPLLLSNAFLAKPLAKNEIAEMKEIEPPHYLISIFEESESKRILKRKLWVNRQNLTIEKEIHYSPQGIPEGEYIRKDYHKELFLQFPRTIQLKKPSKNETVVMKLEKPLLNSKISDNVFEFRPPQGVIIETVN